MKRLLKTLAATIAVLAATAGSAFAAGTGAVGDTVLVDRPGCARRVERNPSSAVEPERLGSRAEPGQRRGRLAVERRIVDRERSEHGADTQKARARRRRPAVAAQSASGRARRRARGRNAGGGRAAAPASRCPHRDSTQSNERRVGRHVREHRSDEPGCNAVLRRAAGAACSRRSRTPRPTRPRAQRRPRLRIDPSNSNISVRVLSPGNDGAVLAVERGLLVGERHELGGDDAGQLPDRGRLGGVQSSTQNADTSQGQPRRVLGDAGPPRELEHLGARPEPGERRLGVAVEQGGVLRERGEHRPGDADVEPEPGSDLVRMHEHEPGRSGDRPVELRRAGRAAASSASRLGRVERERSGPDRERR